MQYLKLKKIVLIGASTGGPGQIKKITIIEEGLKGIYFKEQEHLETSFNPNINIIFNSFVQLLQNIEILSIILTDIDDDGVQSCIKLSENGIRCITETSQSAIIDGMPSHARDL